MKAFVFALLVTIPATSAAAQDTVPERTHFTVKSPTDQPLTFRVETKGSGVQVSRAAGITMRGDGNARLLEITAPATLAVEGTNALEIRLLAPDGAQLEVSPEPNDIDGRSIFLRGGTIVLGRFAAQRRIQLVESEWVFVRMKD
jgi:hypothetical protein